MTTNEDVAYQAGRKKALEEVLEWAKGSPLEFTTMHTGSMDQPDGSRTAFVSGQTNPRKVVFLEDLEKFIKEGKN